MDINIQNQNPTIGNEFALPGLMSLGEQVDVNALAKTVAAFFENSLQVTNAPTNNKIDDDKKDAKETGKAGLPAPDKSLITEANIEGLVALLKLVVDEKQADALKKRILNQQSTIDKQAENRMTKIDKNLKDMDKAAKQARLAKAFGWLGAIFAVVMAVVSIATAGVAASLVPIVTAALAVTMQTLQETGVMDKVMKALAESMQNTFGLSKAQAQCAAAIFMAVAMIAVTACGMGALAKFAGDVSSMVKLVSMIGQGVLGVASGTQSVVNAFEQKDAAKTQAELKEIEKLLLTLKKKLEESQDGLENVLKMLEDGVTNMMAFIESQVDSQLTIAAKMKAMA